MIVGNQIDELSSPEKEPTTEPYRAELWGWNPKDEVDHWLKEVNEGKKTESLVYKENLDEQSSRKKDLTTELYRVD